MFARTFIYNYTLMIYQIIAMTYIRNYIFMQMTPILRISKHQQFM